MLEIRQQHADQMPLRRWADLRQRTHGGGALLGVRHFAAQGQPAAAVLERDLILAPVSCLAERRCQTTKHCVVIRIQADHEPITKRRYIPHGPARQRHQRPVHLIVARLEAHYKRGFDWIAQIGVFNRQSGEHIERLRAANGLWIVQLTEKVVPARRWKAHKAKDHRGEGDQ